MEQLNVALLGTEATPEKQSAQPIPRDKTRLQIDIDPKQMARIEAIMSLCELGTKKEMFEYAVTLLEWAANHRRNQRVIAALNPVDETYIELEMPPLNNAAQVGVAA